MKIVIVSDAWYPQINGVVNTLNRTCEELRKIGHEVSLVHPRMFASLPTPFEPGLRAAVVLPTHLEAVFRRERPDAIHIATEGPLGWAARSAANGLGLRFSTAYHTRYPEYLKMRFKVPAQLSLAVLKHFHSSSQVTMVPSRSMRRDLSRAGFTRLAIWGRGVDTSLFSPGASSALDQFDGPKYLFVGRVSPEKDLPDFLDLDLPGKKIVVGTGPLLPRFQRQYPDVHFAGPVAHEDLVHYYRAADVFVFPSKTDTFGLVLLEALACGLPVAALPVPGPVDVLRQCEAAVLDEDLRSACIRATDLSPEAAVDYAALHRWSETTRQFVSLLSAPCKTEPMPKTTGNRSLVTSAKAQRV